MAMEPVKVSCQLTVLFEDPFWVGLLERTDEQGYAVARVVFGAEPSEAEVYEYVLRHSTAIEFSQPIAGDAPSERKVGFKRKQREARRALAEPRRMTRAQEAIQMAYEMNQQDRHESAREEREALAEHKYRVRQEKRKEKHRGH